MHIAKQNKKKKRCYFRAPDLIGTFPSKNMHWNTEENVDLAVMILHILTFHYFILGSALLGEILLHERWISNQDEVGQDTWPGWSSFQRFPPKKHHQWHVLLSRSSEGFAWPLPAAKDGTATLSPRVPRMVERIQEQQQENACDKEKLNKERGIKNQNENTGGCHSPQGHQCPARVTLESPLTTSGDCWAWNAMAGPVPLAFLATLLPPVHLSKKHMGRVLNCADSTWTKKGTFR